MLLAKPLPQSMTTFVLSAASTRNLASAAVALLAVHGPRTVVTQATQILITLGSRAFRLVQVTHTSQDVIYFKT